jgi:hypothetical protein
VQGAERIAAEAGERGAEKDERSVQFAQGLWWSSIRWAVRVCGSCGSQRRAQSPEAEARAPQIMRYANIKPRREPMRSLSSLGF